MIPKDPEDPITFKSRAEVCVMGIKLGIKALIRPSLVALLLIFLSSPSLCTDGSYDWLGIPVLKGYGILPAPDWLNPYNAGRPEWDPFGPGANQVLIPPFGTISAYSLQMISANPFNEGLQIKDSVQSSNKIYLEQGGLLVTQGSVDLAETYVIWAMDANGGIFTLYDHGQLIMSNSNLAPGWYKITGLYSEVLGDHRYHFISNRLSSNNLSILVSSAGYPTSFSLTGRVVNQSGNGIPGARVIISSSEGGTFTVYTNAFGYYGMDVPSGVYSITAQLSGYQFTQSTARVWSGAVYAARKIIGYTSLVVGTGYIPTTPTYLAFNFPNTSAASSSTLGQLKGKVADQSGIGIDTAEIIVDGVHTDIFTNSSGEYQISISPGIHRIEAQKAGYGIMPRAIHVLQGQVVTLDLFGKKAAKLG